MVALAAVPESQCLWLQYVAQGLHYKSQHRDRLERHIQCVEDTQALRDRLSSAGLVAFVANGAVLPRSSGASGARSHSLRGHEVQTRCTVI